MSIIQPNGDITVTQGIDIDITSTENPVDTGKRILHVGGRIALHGHHLLFVKFVVAAAIV